MSRVFIEIFNMSVTGSYIILVVLVLRLALKKAPKWLPLLLWGVVGVRLICPFNFESILSVLPSVGRIRQDVPGRTYDGELSYLNTAIFQVNQEVFPASQSVGLNRWFSILGWMWLLGILVLLTYSIISYCKVRRSVLTAVRLEDRIYQSEHVQDPFVLGFFRPKIYLPFNMDEGNRTYVIAHEQAHILRLDHLWKPLGFAVLAVHWFNPLVWLSYLLFCRDLEFACDEKAVRSLSREARADYSQALLSCSVHKPGIAVCPLAFGEVGVKKRIKSVLRYQKPAFWVVLVALVVCLSAAVCFFIEPLRAENVGVQRVTVHRISEDRFELHIKHSGCFGKYSVEQVSMQDAEHTSNGAVPYDGALGQNRIMVSFGDDDIAASLAKRMSIGSVAELTDSPVRILTKWTCPGDHGFTLYFGMDENIRVEEVHGDLEEWGGTLIIPVQILPGE